MGSFESNVAKRRNDLDQGRQASGDSGWVMADILSESRSWEATRSLTIQDGPACASESMADLHDVPKEENGCCAISCHGASRGALVVSMVCCFRTVVVIKATTKTHL